MRKLVFALMLTFAVGSMAQNRVYCEIFGSIKTLNPKINVVIEFGQPKNLWTGYSNQFIVDEKGKPKEFNSMIEAMNFMAKLGWRLEQTYVLQSGSSNDVHWVLGKDITNDEEFKKGIMTKGDFMQK